VLFELRYADEKIAREAIERAIQKLPMKARFVAREEVF
jgi:large subunit ribosomal protein L16